MLKWEGEKVKQKLTRAAIRGVDVTMAACSIHAKQNHPWRNRTGILEGSIRPVIAAHVRGGEVVGVWGSASVLYAIYLEIGNYPFLRPAADVEYPKLTSRIRQAFN